MKKCNYEVWEFNGIPQDAPVLETSSLMHLKWWLGSRTYLDYKKDVVANEGMQVFCNDEKIDLNTLFPKEEYYTDKQWGNLVND